MNSGASAAVGGPRRVAGRPVRWATLLKAAKLVVFWIATGVGLTSVVAFLIGVVSALFEPGGGLRQIAGSGAYFVLMFLAWFACVAPGVVALCALWPRLARSVPHVEGSVFIVATCLASLASSLAVYLIVLGPGTDPWVATLPFLASWLPLVLPRVVFSRARAPRAA